MKFNTLYLEVTHACNQNCLHCYLDGGIHRKIMEMTTAEIKNLFYEFKEQGGKYIIITGGEPTIRKDIFEILDYLDSLDIPFQLATNCLSLDRKKLNRIVNYKNLGLIFTSFLGTNKEQHLAISGKDTFDHIFQCIDFFDSHKMATYVQVTLAKDFIKDSHLIAEKLAKYENLTFKITPISNTGIKKKSKNIILPENRYREFLDILKPIQEKYGEKVDYSNLVPFKEVLAEIEENKKSDLYSLQYKCLNVRPNGDKSFSYSVDNPFVFGKVQDGIEVKLDENFKNYIKLLKKVDEKILAKSKPDQILDYYDLIDDYLKRIFHQ